MLKKIKKFLNKKLFFTISSKIKIKNYLSVYRTLKFFMFEIIELFRLYIGVLAFYAGYGSKINSLQEGDISKLFNIDQMHHVVDITRKCVIENHKEACDGHMLSIDQWININMIFSIGLIIETSIIMLLIFLLALCCIRYTNNKIEEEKTKND